MTGFKEGDIVIRKVGKQQTPAEVRAVFASKRGKPFVVVEYERDVFRVFRPVSLVKVEEPS